MQLEAWGFCGPGEAKDLVADGHLDLGGDTPCNTHGGLIGEGYIHGLNLVSEAVRQLRGVAANQVQGAARALVAGGRGAAILTTA
jgi:acetyl-CoA acetyltransferase